MPQRVLTAFASAALAAAFPEVTALPGGGSARRYFRLHGPARTVVGAVAEDRAELRAFLAFTRHFAALGIPVPVILAADEAGGLYVMEDLGDATLRDRLAAWRAAQDEERRWHALQTAVRWLPVIQVRGGDGLDYSLCSEGPELGVAAYRADARLFREEFLPRHAPSLAPTRAVLDDLDALVERLGALPREHFCYRDFQTRNVMWPKDGPVFIDYQSGRRGPLAYDLASILYSPDSGLSTGERERLTDAYLQALAACGVAPERSAFLADFHALVLLRRLQALGAYARIERVKYSDAYQDKIAPALATLAELQRARRLEFGLPALEAWLERIFALRIS